MSMTISSEIMQKALRAAQAAVAAVDAEGWDEGIYTATDIIATALQEAVTAARAEEWQPIETAPEHGQFLVAEFAPTNWAYCLKAVRIIEGSPERHREIQLQYATHWRPYLAAPAIRSRATLSDKDGK